MSKSYEEIKALMEMFDDLPDGAFFAVMEEHGVFMEDMDAISLQLEKDWAAEREAKRLQKSTKGSKRTTDLAQASPKKGRQ